MSSLSLSSASSQHATASDSASLSPSSAITVETWAYFLSTPGSTAVSSFTIVQKLSALSTTYGPYSLQVADTGGGTIALVGNAIVDDAVSNNAVAVATIPSFALNTWFHLAWTYDGTRTPRSKLYIDGTEPLVYTSQSGTTAAAYDSSGALAFGGGTRTSGSPGQGNAVNANYFNGYLSNCRVWNVARSQSDINNYKCTYIASDTGLVAAWSLNNVYTDGTGNGNTLTPVNSPVFVGSNPSCITSFGAVDNSLFFAGD